MAARSPVPCITGSIIDLEDGEATGADKGCARSFPVKLENGRIYLDMGVAAPA